MAHESERFFVYTETSAGEVVTTGTLQLDDAGERPAQILAEFSYDQTYLARSDAAPLDPLNLPLRNHAFRTTSRFHVLGALFDATPDAWGRTVIRACNGGTMPSERNMFLSNRGLGAGSLFFAPVQLPKGMRTANALPSISEVANLDDILTLEKALAAVDAGSQLDEAWRPLLSNSGDIGGARPKAVVRDSDNGLWIAKFPRQKDSFDRQRVEWANLEMARDIGMNVPEARLIEVSRSAALLVKRFDREVVDGEIRRRHYVSAATLVSPAPDFDKRDMDKPLGVTTFSYARLADVIRRVSSHPVRDLQELYARMVLNIAVHNTDDHLKNTGFVRDQSSKTGSFRLAPLFDVVTQEGNAKHMLHIGPAGRESTFENALDGAARMNVRSHAAEEILARVLSITARRNEYYERAGLSSRGISLVERCLSAGRAVR